MHNGTTATAVTSGLATPPFTSITDPHRYSGDNNRRAYLTVLFFDERFNYISDGSTNLRAVNANNNAAPLVLANIKAPKNGYAYIYVSNESDDAVFFDDLQVSHNRGRIIEENHYYAYGLKIAGISSHKLADANEGNTDNKHLYNDKELDDEGDLNWLDYGFRNYDPQIGRFVQIDPLTDEMPDISTYHYAYNDPITNIDQDGLIGIPCPGSGSLGIALQKVSEAVTRAVSAIGSLSNLTVTAISASLNVASKVGKEIDQNNRIGKQVGQIKIKDEPGALYETIDDAAIGWGKKYGKTSINEHVELSSIIYEIKKGKKSYYSFTRENHFEDGDPKHNNTRTSPGVKEIKDKHPNYIPKGGIIRGHIHSHPWGTSTLGENNKTFSNNNQPGAVKYDIDDEVIMATDKNYYYYMYNFYGEIRARKPESEGGLRPQSEKDEMIMRGLPWDKNATKKRIKMGPYVEPGKPEYGPDYEGNKNGPIKP